MPSPIFPASLPPMDFSQIQYVAALPMVSRLTRAMHVPSQKNLVWV